MFLFALCVFFTNVYYLGPLFLYTIHLGRGGLGGFICLKLPNFNYIIKESGFDDKDKVNLGDLTAFSLKGF